jgi:hypothetical protein
MIIDNKLRFLGYTTLLIFLSSCGIIAGIFMNKFVGGTGKLKLYTYSEYTKKEFNDAVQCVYKNYSQYIPPEKYKNTMIHFYSNLSSPESRRFNADTVQFHFYVKTITGDEILFWTAFVGLEENWNTLKYEYGISCELGLRGYEKNEEGLLIHEDFKNEKAIKKDPYIKLFETEILPKIQGYLVNPCNAHE